MDWPSIAVGMNACLWVGVLVFLVLVHWVRRKS